jgi:general secretion pathway protein N
MLKYSGIICPALLSGLILVVGWVPAPRAATSATLDIVPDSLGGPPSDQVDIGSLKPISRTNREAAKPLPGGNPLWSVPLSVLTATQERPIFSASRRPPPRAVAAAPVEQVIARAPPKAEPERLSLALIGAVVGDSDAIAVFLDQTNQKMFRLRQGETHAGWELSSVLPREVTLKKDDRTEVLALQRPDSSAPAGPGVPAAGGPVVAPGAGRLDTSYAPFIPRSTPKNGAPDGL